MDNVSYHEFREETKKAEKRTSESDAKRKRAAKIEKGRTPRVTPLGKAWWLKRPREHNEAGPMLEREIGPVAYRGRTNYIRKKEPKSLDAAAKGEDIAIQERFIPRNTIRSERMA